MLFKPLAVHTHHQLRALDTIESKGHLIRFIFYYGSKASIANVTCKY